MGAMNRGLNLQTIQRIMNEFERENSMMDMKEEMMSETVDDVMDEEEDEEEGDKVLKEVLDELGVSLSQQVRPERLDCCLMILAHCRSSLMHRLLVLRRQHLW
jgi:division protein CdvB (Snf7/Vps24/ESCRT-III family)